MCLRSLLALLLCVSTLYAQGFSPEDAVKRMKLPEGFSARCVAHEPMIRQPLSMSFDHQGRMWVLQYLQYPNPAGMKALKQDQYLRTIWDRVPEPPPKGPKGLDRITICSDPDEHGVFRKSKDFVTGLNLASGFCLANDGVYVVQPPYLLFYPDVNHDDVPDGDPKVLLSGFGLDDTHSLANSLQFGPDGWLYGAAGSTSTCKIQDPSGKAKEPIEFQQGIWRYHPKTRQFELFSEGGGNTYGLDFDRNGECIAGTNWGGFAMLHQMQGAYHVKGFSKHGPLHNPYTYGYFDHVPYRNFKGGHVTCGGVLYEADAYPKEYRGQYIAGNLLSNAIYTHKMTAKGASYTAEHGSDLLESQDSWFRPVDLQLGPDGCIYVVDWYDRRAAHLDPIDNWDKTNGRIYKIEYKSAKPLKAFDLNTKSNAELVELLNDGNIWYRRQAREVLSGRKLEPQLIAKVQKNVASTMNTVALESLWLLNGISALDTNTLSIALSHPDEHVREWAIRLAADRFADIPEENWSRIWPKMISVAEHETSPVVLCQLAASAKRLPTRYAVELISALLGQEKLPTDPAVRLMLWWAIEAHGDSACPDWSHFTTTLKADEDRAFLLDRIARRMAATNSAHLPELLPTSVSIKNGQLDLLSRAVLQGIDLGLDPQKVDRFRASLLTKLHQLQKQNLKEPLLTRLLVRLGDEAETKLALARMTSDKLPERERIEAIQLLTLVKYPRLSVEAQVLLRSEKSTGLLLAGIAAAETFDDPQIGLLLLGKYASWTAPVQKRALQALLHRPAWAHRLMAAYSRGEIPKADITLDHARQLIQFQDAAITALVEKQFGKIAASTAGEKKARIDSLNAMLGREKAGNIAAGKVVFTKTCAACHQLHGEGTKIGPDLTTADRKSRISLLTNIVDPSGYIRSEYISYTANTLDGRTLTGLVIDQNPEAITLASYVNAKVEKAVLVKRDLDKFDPSPVSIMPEKLLDSLSETEIRDLFAYLASDPVKPKEPGPAPKPSDPTAKKIKYKIGLVSGSLEYKSDNSLTTFAKELEDKYPVQCLKMYRKTDTEIENLNQLRDCDLVVFFTRRLTIDGDQLKAVKEYCASGKPIIGIRTASHGFQKWLEMDREVYGGDYKNHFGEGPKCELNVTRSGKDHPILKGFTPFASNGSLYKNPAVARDAVVILQGTIPKQSEPVAWVREREIGSGKQRVFYTSLGHPDDFTEAAFRRLLVNAIGWCLKDEPTFGK